MVIKYLSYFWFQERKCVTYVEFYIILRSCLVQNCNFRGKRATRDQLLTTSSLLSINVAKWWPFYFSVSSLLFTAKLLFQVNTFYLDYHSSPQMVFLQPQFVLYTTARSTFTNLWRKNAVSSSSPSRAMIAVNLESYTRLPTQWKLRFLSQPELYTHDSLFSNIAFFFLHFNSSYFTYSNISFRCTI